MNLTDLSIKRPVFITMMMMALAVFGVISFKELGVDLFPKVEFPVITIVSAVPGTDPETMEHTVTEPIEEAVSSLSSIRHIRSTSAESVSQIIVEFELEKNVDIAYQEVQAKIGTVRKQLPSDLKEIAIEKFDIDSMPIMAVVVSGNLPVQKLTQIVDKRMKDRLQQVSGVGQIKLVGNQERNIWVYIDPFKLEGVSTSVQDVIDAVKNHHLDFPGGRIETGTKELTVKTKAEFSESADLANAIIAYRNGYPVTIADVGHVVDGVQEPRTLSQLDDQEAIALLIRRQSGTNTVKVAHGIKKALDKLRTELAPEGIKIEIAQDFSVQIEQAMDEIQFHLVFGALLAVLIVFLFLWNWRVTFISALAIPISVVSTFIWMRIMGFTMNNMTMLALSLSIGILIDDAIVVVENIYRHFKHGKSAIDAVRFGVSEIGLAAFGITMSIVAVFVPVAFMKGIVGRFFYQFGLTVTFAVLTSLFVAFTLIPMLATKFLKNSERKISVSDRLLSKVDYAYKHLLKLALHHRKTTIGTAILLLALTLFSSKFIPAEFIPQEDQSEFAIKVRTPLGSTLRTTAAVMQEIRQKIKEQNWLVYTFSTIGSDSFGKVNEGSIYVKMVDKGMRHISQSDAMKWTREHLAMIPDAKISIEPVPLISDGGGKLASLQLDIKGAELDKIEAISQKVIELLQQKEGYVDLDISYEKGKPELEIAIKRDRAAALEVTPSDIAMAVKPLVGGVDINKFRADGNRYNITLRLDERYRLSPHDVQNLSVRSSNGNLITLSNLINLSERDGPIQIDRDNRFRMISVFANFQEGKKVLGDAINEISSSLKDFELPSGYSIEFSGDAEAMEDSFNNLGFALILAVVMVYMVLASLFESFTQPFIIMLALPFSLVGSLGILIFTQMTLSIFTIIGIIMLMGLVTKNAILLIDYTNTLRFRDGLSKEAAILQAGPTRLHPILMTTSAMISGMLPVALDNGTSAETRGPMAMAIIGGLITSMLLTLVVVPVVYSVADDMVAVCSRYARKVKNWRSAPGSLVAAE
jgi:HAE1 family hydrophobic/amphiphilic exporter-1